MKLLIFGPPGSGKGTLAKHISNIGNITHVSTGDIFRQHIKDNDYLGLQIMQINQGGLVPDSLTNNLINDRLSQDDLKENYILDGYPRTINQVKFLKNISTITGVIFIDLADDAIINRITRRRVCPNDGNSYHLDFNKPKVSGVCDICGGKLVQREDDKPETAKNRLATYKEKTVPIINFLKNEKIPIFNVRGDYDIHKVDVLVKKIIKFFKNQKSV